MTPLYVAWVASLVCTGWFLSVGIIRILAHRAGVDATHGMRLVARVAVALGGVAAVAFVVLTAVIAGR